MARAPSCRVTIAPVPLPLLFMAAAIAPGNASSEGSEFTGLFEALLASDEPAPEAAEEQIDPPPEHAPPPVALAVAPPPPPPPVLVVVADASAGGETAPEQAAAPVAPPEPPLRVDTAVAFEARIVEAEAEAPADTPAPAPKPAPQALSQPQVETEARVEPAPRVEPVREPERVVERQAAPERPAEVALPQHAHATAAAPAPRAESPALPNPASRIEPPAPPEPPRAEVRGVSVVVPTETGRDGSPAPRIELHLAERAGEIHVAVRAPDPQVRQVLRSELPVLVERLEQSGYRTEVFSPATERSAAAAETQVARMEAPADSGGRDPMSWGFDDGRRQREQEARPQPGPRPKSQTRSFFHEFFR